MVNKKKPIKVNDQQLLLMPKKVSDLYHQLTVALFDNIIERLHDRGTYYLKQQPWLWQLEKMNDLGLLNDENIATIAYYSDIGEELIREIIVNEGYKVYKDTHEQLNSNAYENDVMEILNAYANQAIKDIDNLINTTLPMSVREVYQDIVEETVAKVVTGIASPEQALNETIMKWHKRGFYGYTDRAGRRQRADSYARTVITTTTNNVYREMRMRPALELGIDTFYYSIKASARAMCAPIQNKIVTTGHARVENGVKIHALSDYGYGKPGGCLGINCGHTLTPFIPGLNYLPDIDDDLKGLTKKQAIENANIQAKQRAMERSIRFTKEQIHVADQLHDDDLSDKYRTKLKNQKQALESYVDKHDFLYRDLSREKYWELT